MAHLWTILEGKKVLSDSSHSGSTLALMVALKRGTVRTSISTGTGILKGQIYNFQIHSKNYAFNFNLV